MFTKRTRNATLRRIHRAQVNREKAQREFYLSIVAAHLNGASRAEIAEAAGITAERVRQILVEHG